MSPTSVKKAPLVPEGILLQIIANQIHMIMAMQTLPNMGHLHAHLSSAAALTELLLTHICDGFVAG